METIALHPPKTQETKVVSSSVEKSALTWYSYALLISSLSIVTGVIWDISWHMSIGRDTLFSPPHMAIYLGGILAGISSFYKVISISFFSSSAEKEKAVSFWGLKAPVGALFCIWGAGAMVTSAPFDDWWHNAYGLDVKILSPPHTLLAFGIIFIQLGAMLHLLALQNQSEKSLTDDGSKHTLRLLFALMSGILVIGLYIFSVEYMGRAHMHNPIYYQVACGVLPLCLISGMRASRLKWPAVTIAAVYMMGFILALWILPLFHAEPKLAPIRYRVDHMVPLPFPTLLIIPALGLDLVMRRFKHRSLWMQALVAGSVFFTCLLAAQWFFSIFMMSPYARNWVFGAHEWAYYANPNAPYRYAFRPFPGTQLQYFVSFASALAIAVLSSRIALAWGNWMRRVQR